MIFGVIWCHDVFEAGQLKTAGRRNADPLINTEPVSQKWVERLLRSVVRRARRPVHPMLGPRLASEKRHFLPHLLI